MPPNSISPARIARALFALGLTLLVATGCVKVDLSVTISEDDTVAGEYVVAVSESVMNDLSDLGESADPFESSSNPFGDEGTVEDYEEEIDGERYVGKRYRVESAPIDEVNAAMTETGEGLTITRSGDRFIVELMMSSDDVEEYPGLTAEFADEITFTVSVTFPGKVIESNGELSDGGRTVTWVVDLTKDTELRAVGDASDSLPIWVWFIIGGGVLGLAAIVVVVVVMSKRRPGAPTDTVPGHPVGPGDQEPRPAPPQSVPPVDPPPHAPDAASTPPDVSPDPWAPRP